MATLCVLAGRVPLDAGRPFGVAARHRAGEARPQPEARPRRQRRRREGAQESRGK